MKVIYEFDPIEDKEYLEEFQKSESMSRLIAELAGELRSAEKYNGGIIWDIVRSEMPNDPADEAVYEICSKLQKRFHEMMMEYGL